MQVPEGIRENSVGTAETADRKTRFQLLFSDYDLRCIQANDREFTKEYIIGRGSHNALGIIEEYTIDENMPALLKVGRMCNFAKQCVLLVDGEHKNDHVINIMFAEFPDAYNALRNRNQILLLCALL